MSCTLTVDKWDNKCLNDDVSSFLQNSHLEKYTVATIMTRTCTPQNESKVVMLTLKLPMLLSTILSSVLFKIQSILLGAWEGLKYIAKPRTLIQQF